MIQDKSDSKITDIFVEFLKSSSDYKYQRNDLPDGFPGGTAHSR